MFFELKQKFWENVPKEAAFNCEAAKLYKFYSFRMCLVILNSVHKLTCETKITLLST